MPIEVPACCDTQYELLSKILLTLGFVADGGTSTFQSGSQSIANNVDTVSVVFPTPYTTIPDVVISLSRPQAEPLIDGNIDEASITLTGFTVSLGATTGSANYNLKWMAN